MTRQTAAAAAAPLPPRAAPAAGGPLAGAAAAPALLADPEDGPPAETAYVYVMADQFDVTADVKVILKRFKVGWAYDPAIRLHRLSAGNPNLRLIRAYPVRAPALPAEQHAHHELEVATNTQHVHEWFAVAIPWERLNSFMAGRLANFAVRVLCPVTSC